MELISGDTLLISGAAYFGDPLLWLRERSFMLETWGNMDGLGDCGRQNRQILQFRFRVQSKKQPMTSFLTKKEPTCKKQPWVPDEVLELCDKIL